MRYWLRNLGIGTILLSLPALFAWTLVPRRSTVVTAQAKNQFPPVVGTNLIREDLEFPRDFAGEYNLVFIAFWQWQQETINTWLPFAREIEATFPGVIYYELPTIKDMSALRRLVINEGMRAGIPEQLARERTVTLYLNKQPFLRQLDIESQDDIHIFLVKREGEIVWRTMGALTDIKAQELRSLLKDKFNR